MAETGQYIEFYQEDDHFPQVEVTDDNNDPKALDTAQEITFTVHDTPQSSAFLTKTETGGGITVTGANNNIAEIEIGPSDTTGLSGEYFWKLVVVDAAGRTSHTSTGPFIILPGIPVIVRLYPEMDYLKRITNVVPSASKGITRLELDRASKTAEDEVLLALSQLGFNITAFNSTATMPHNVQEIVRMLGAARVWNRMLMLYDNERPFTETFGAALLNTAQHELDRIVQNPVLLHPTTRAIIEPTVGQTGKGYPNFRSPKLLVYPNKQIVPDSEINDFIEDHGANSKVRYQSDPYRYL